MTAELSSGKKNLLDSTKEHRFTAFHTFKIELPMDKVETLGIVTIGPPKSGKSSFLKTLFQALGLRRTFKPGKSANTRRLTVDVIDPKVLPEPIRGDFDPNCRIQCIDICGKDILRAEGSFTLASEIEKFLEVVVKGLKANTELLDETASDSWKNPDQQDPRNRIDTLVIGVKAPTLECAVDQGIFDHLISLQRKDRVLTLFQFPGWLQRWIPSWMSSPVFAAASGRVQAVVSLVDSVDKFCKGSDSLFPPYNLLYVHS
jgi:hypothetical protein